MQKKYHFEVKHMNKRKNIGVFGHYGNQNLGDEAIIESMINNLNRLLSNPEISCLSINPFDSAQRYNVKSFPIRYRKDFFIQSEFSSGGVTEGGSASSSDASSVILDEQKRDFKLILKSIPLLGCVLRSLAKSVSLSKKIKDELYFLMKARSFLIPMDLLLITGSNQLLDNFGGPWGFPYTLLKWTILGRITKTKVAYVSVGGGPLTQKLSYRMLKIALKNADYISYRDKGSKELIENRISTINGSIYPDIAHSLSYVLPKNDDENLSNMMVVGVNPMPVYDKRYWATPDDKKYNDYVMKVSETCAAILEEGHILKLFITQTRDGDVIADIMHVLSADEKFETWEKNIVIKRDSTVDDLMQTIGSCDIVVATRFHATILPLQLNIPVLGICYYRKSSELLQDVGLGGYHVDIEDFTADILIEKLSHLINNYETASNNISINYDKYKEDLESQYNKLICLI